MKVYVLRLTNDDAVYGSSDNIINIISLDNEFYCSEYLMTYYEEVIQSEYKDRHVYISTSANIGYSSSIFFEYMGGFGELSLSMYEVEEVNTIPIIREIVDFNPGE